jgi:RNA polymerase sigma-B factor
VKREQLIESHLPLVRAIARRYAGRGETLEDLVQVGALGLIRASDRYDPIRGVAFATFATPAIEGEIRRHLGDRTTSVRIPRELQQMTGQLQRCRTQLGASLGRDPTIDELAAALGITSEDVERGLAAERARERSSESPPVEEVLGDYEQGPAADDRLLLGLAARVLNVRERRVVFLRFYADLTERDIAHELGISQAQVSRLLGRALGKLREELDADNSRSAAADISDEAAISQGRPAKKMQSRRQARRKATSAETSETKIRNVGASQQRVDPMGAGSADEKTVPAADSPPRADVELPYHVIVRAEGERGWKAAIEELPGCEGHGSNPEEAVERLRATMETWLSAAMDDRRVISPPKRQSSKRTSTANPSGRFLVRMPSELHQQLASAAEREQVSLNRYVTDALAASVTATSAAEPHAAPASEARPRRGFRMLLAANVIVMMSAAVAAVALLILALERGI